MPRFTKAGAPALPRYQRVQQILDQAAGSSPASYQGHGPFWRLPLNQSVELTLYGVRIIAPPESAVLPQAVRRPPGPKTRVATESARRRLHPVPSTPTDAEPRPWDPIRLGERAQR